MEWDTPIGIAKACGGDALIRASAFLEVGGYDVTVIAGEEPEMCVRLREKGWTIHRIDAEMTLHDAAITHFSQWWKRNVRSGHAYAQGNFMHGAAPEFFRQTEVRGIEKWAIFPILFVLVAVGLIAAVSPHWCFLGLLLLALYPLLAVKIARQRMNRGTSLAVSFLYGCSVAIGKFPQWQGIQKFRYTQRKGQRSAIIEYKKA